ncbi:MAG: STAS domain-containing protein [Planctomycetota bacterium]
MKVEFQKHGSVTVVIPRDALTEATVPEVQSTFEQETARAAKRLVLEMNDVPYVDSTGIEFLLAFAGETATGTMRPRVVGLTDTVREALYITDTLKRFLLFDSVEAAVRSFV